jgi:hypothetical protein
MSFTDLYRPTGKQVLAVSLSNAERAGLLYASLPVSLTFNALLATLLLAAQWPAVESGPAILWLIGMALVLVMRAAIYRLYRGSAKDQSHGRDHWLTLFRAGALATGSVWGFAAVVLFPPGDLFHQVFLTFVLAGICAGAITSLAVDRVSVLGFLLPALLPLILALISEGDSVRLTMSLMVVLFIIFLGSSAGRARRYLLDNARLRAEALDQEAKLRHQKQLLAIIADAQSRFIRRADDSRPLEGLLTGLMDLTGSQSGIICEVVG